MISITYSVIAPLVLGFSTIGLYFFYFAFRYNLLYVNTSDIDTKGLVYPRALQHTLVGCYLSMICLIGLFAIRAAAGPLILMIIFLIFSILYHISLSSAISPLLHYLPRSLEAEEDALMSPQNDVMSKQATGNGADLKNGMATNAEASDGQGSPLAPAPHKKPNLFTKFLRPDIYTDYATCRRLVPRDFAEIAYSSEIERHAYYNPAITRQTPLLWVPRDAGGVSRQECSHTSQITPMTDEATSFDEKGKMIWDQEGSNGRPPIYEEMVYY